MVRTVSLVKSKADAFKVGLLAENVEDESQNSNQFDSFILSEPGVPAVKVTEENHIVDSVMMLNHRYSNIQGNNFMTNLKFP